MNALEKYAVKKKLAFELIKVAAAAGWATARANPGKLVTAPQPKAVTPAPSPKPAPTKWGSGGAGFAAASASPGSLQYGTEKGGYTNIAARTPLAKSYPSGKLPSHLADQKPTYLGEAKRRGGMGGLSNAPGVSNEDAAVIRQRTDVRDRARSGIFGPMARSAGGYLKNLASQFGIGGKSLTTGKRTGMPLLGMSGAQRQPVQAVTR